MSSRIEQALATLRTNLDTLADATVERDFDLAVPWTSMTMTTRFVNLQSGTFAPFTRNMQTIWKIAAVLALHVKAETPDELGALLLALHSDVMTVLGTDPTLGGVAAWCEPSEDEPATSAPAEGEAGPEMAMTMPLSIAVATLPNDLAHASAA